MNATIMKGERSKLLAVVAVMAMVACALVAFMPSADAESNVLPAANDNNTIKLVEDTVLTEPITLTSDQTLDLAGFNLTVPTINVNGARITDSTYTSGETSTISVTTAITISADSQISNVTIDSAAAMATAIGYGVSATYTNVSFTGDDCYTAIYFCVGATDSEVEVNGGDLNGKLINYDTNAATSGGKVTVSGASDVSLGILNNSNTAQVFTYGTTFDIDENTTIDTIMVGHEQCTTNVTLSVPADETISCVELTGPGIIYTPNPINIVSEKPSDVTIIESAGNVITVNNYTDLITAIDGTYATIVIDGNIQVPSVITVQREVIIVGINDATLEAIPNDGPYNGEWSSGSAKSLISIESPATDVVIKDIVFDSKEAAFGVNVYNATGVSFENVSSNNSAGAGFVFGQDATASLSNISAENYVWGGINVDKGATITFEDVGSFENVGSVYSENYNESVVFPAGYTPAIEMTGKWNGEGSDPTDFCGYYTTLDEILPNYNDEQDRFIYEGSKIAVNKDTTNGSDFTLKSGTTLKIADNVTLTNEDGVSFYVEKNATVDGCIRGGEVEYLDISGMTEFPDMEDGTIVNYSGRTYVVYHADTMTGNWQFGVAVGDFTYTGFNKAGNFRNAGVISLDNTYKDTSGTPTGYVYNQNEVSEEEAAHGEYGECVDVGVYTLHISFTMTNGKETVNVDVEVPISILPAKSEVKLGDATGYGQYQNVTISGSGNEYKASGTVIYTTYSGETGYHLFFTVTAPSGIILSEAMFDGIDYADGIGHVYLGTSVPDEIVFSVDFDGIVIEDGDPNNWTPEAYTLDLSGLSVDSIIELDKTTLETVYGVDVGDLQTGISIDENNNVKGTVFYYDGTWTAGTWGDNMSIGYYVLYDITVPGIEDFWNDGDNNAKLGFTQLDAYGETIRTNTYDGNFDGYLLVFLGTDGIDVAKTEIVVDLDGNSTKYSENKYTVTYDLTTSAKVEFLPITDDNVTIVTGSDNLYGMKPSELQTNLGIDTNLGVTGTVNWVYGYEQFNTAEPNEQYGYYIAFYMQLPGSIKSWEGVSVSTSDGKSWNGTENDVFDGFFVYRVMDNGPIVITIDLGETYEPTEYELDLSALDYQSVAGYIDNDAPSGQGKTETVAGVEIPNVIGQTIWIIYNSEGHSGSIGLNLYYEDEQEPCYISQLEQNNGTLVRYFSFIDQNIEFRAGEYKIEIFCDNTDHEGDRVTITTNTVIVPGAVESGFDEKGEDAQTAMNKYDDINITDAAGATNVMWMVWYGSGYEGVTASLYFGDDLENAIYSETSSDVVKWLHPGIHTWYFSFDYQVEDEGYDFAYGKYTMVITDSDGNKIAEAVEYVVDETMYNVTYIDVDWPYAEGGYRYSQNVKVDTDFILPDLPDGSKTAFGWKVLNPETGDYDVYGENIFVDLSKYVDDYNSVTFYAVYASGEESTSMRFVGYQTNNGVQIQIDALDHNIIPDGEITVVIFYISTFNVDGQVIETISSQTFTQSYASNGYDADNIDVAIDYDEYDTAFRAYATFTANVGEENEATYDVPYFDIEVILVG